MTTRPDESSYLIDCVDCGASIDPAFDRPFAITDEIILCPMCAMRRGGVYDSDDERWAVQPDLTGVTEERAPHP